MLASNELWITTEGQASMYLWIVLRISGVQGDRLQVQTAIEIDRGHDIPLKVGR